VSQFPTCRVLFSCLALASVVARAEPLDLSRVPAKAVWFMHADIDAARESTVINRMYERAMKMHPRLEQMMTLATGMVGMDPRKDLHDITVYGLDTDKKNAVMIVQAAANREFLERMVEKARDHETMKHRSYTLHKWTHKGGKGHAGEPVVGAFYKDTMMVFARSVGQVELALDVLDQTTTSVGPESPLAGRTRPGSILVGRAAEVDPHTKCPVLRQGTGFRVAMGEWSGSSFYRARLEMQSVEAARQVVDVTAGLAALARLRFADEADVMNLVAGLEVMSDGKTCMIAWNATADELWQVVSRMADQVEAKLAAKHAGKKAGCSCGKETCGCGGKGTCPMDTQPATAGGDEDEQRPFRDDEF
jgi:hypothetical protein